MLVAIHQLHYLPWLRYFEKIARSDVFIVLDNIQFTKNGWQNRNMVKTANGVVLLTVPVQAFAGCRLDQVVINDKAPWRKKHWRTIAQAYGKAPYFDDHAPFLEGVYANSWSCLNDLNRYMLEYFTKALGVDTRLVYGSDLRVSGAASERLINLIRAVGGDEYYTGEYAARTYLDVPRFECAGIPIRVQEWESAEYPQLHGEFVADLSIVDLLLNTGPESSSILLK